MPLDDTTNAKEPPSAGATKPTEDMGFHHSHRDGKKVYGYHAVGMLIGAKDGEFLALASGYTTRQSQKLSSPKNWLHACRSRNS
ncbi:MAG: hypothetical protein FWG10_13635 [Eubacteriaceae bacterium]|nr:hypothetical protein [Eubacteriaceae bacterium]